LFWLPVLLVLALLGAAATTYWLDRDRPDPDRDPEQVAPPPGLELPPLTTPSPVAAAAVGTADPVKVRRALEPLLSDRDLGPHVLAAVAGQDGTPLFARGAGEAVPASTLKLLTGAAALETMGPDRTFATTVVTAGPRRIVLVGGGDPLLAATRPDRDAYPRPADVATLARATATRLLAGGTARVRLGYDATLFTGPAVSPHWPDSYISDQVVAPIQSLWVDGGRPVDDGSGRVADPARTAAVVFGAALAKAGVRVVGVPTPRRADPGAAEVARVTSPPLSQLVEHTLLVSDNEAAEVLARQVAIATGAPATFAGGADAVLDTVAGLGVPTSGATTYDGSGLSRDNRLDPDLLTALLDVSGSAEHPELRPVLTGLPVAGFNGSLSRRFTETADRAGRGSVRAKTGTLTGVSGLAGTVTDRTGIPMVFAVLADDIALPDTLDAREALDGIASALAACRCAA
jgi:D-alanyl-D-alanine carboxypeptidase/D-alanyl-D-alanine-endopeptidase (penicillin-binding protein 4)